MHLTVRAQRKRSLGRMKPSPAGQSYCLDGSVDYAFTFVNGILSLIHYLLIPLQSQDHYIFYCGLFAQDNGQYLNNVTTALQ